MKQNNINYYRNTWKIDESFPSISQFEHKNYHPYWLQFAPIPAKRKVQYFEIYKNEQLFQNDI